MVIYYFTGTGNCLGIAKQISSEIDGSKIVSIVQAVKRKPIVMDGDEIVIVFPLYCAGLPRIVVDFFNGLEFQGGGCFISVLVGAAFPWSGYALHQATRLLGKKGRRIDFGIYVETVENFLPKYRMWDAGVQSEINTGVKTEVKRICRAIKNRERFIDRDPAFLLYAIYPFLMKWLSSQYKKYTAGADCNRCAICAQVCPVDNVEMTGSGPRWKGSCEMCMACIQYCPKQTIQWGKHTADRGRYHHPEIGVRDLRGQKGAAAHE